MNIIKKNIFYLLLFLLLNLLIGIGNAYPQQKEVVPPDILPVIILQGSDYEMGYQYGQQAGHLIEKTKDAAWGSALENFTYEEVIRALKANQYYIKKYTPELIDFLRGIADGATTAGYAVTYIDAVLMNCTLPNPKTSHYPEGVEDATFPPKGCSVCSAWGTATKDGKLIGMDTLDSGEALYGVVIVAFPDNGNAYMCAPQAGEIGDHFLMNNKGFFLGNSGGGGSPRDIDNDYGLCWACSLPYIVRFANNAIEARDMMLKWKINVPENFHFVDTKGNAFVVEKTAALQSVRKSGDFGERDFMFSTNNYLNEEMKVTKKGGFIKNHGGYGAYSAPRNLVLWDMLHNYHGAIDPEFMKMILRFPGAPPPYPPEEGWDAKICRPSNSWVSVLIPDDGNEGIAHICTGPAGRVIHSSTASDGSVMRSGYYYVDGTHTFYTLQLAENPKEVAKAAKREAKNCIATAYKKLMYMNFTDSGYAALNDLYSLANAEYYKGNNFLDKSYTASGNDALSYLTKATTEFARCQAHARQVYEALVPAPTSPSDLGLRPFGGDWATWETNVGKPK